MTRLWREYWESSNYSTSCKGQDEVIGAAVDRQEEEIERLIRLLDSVDARVTKLLRCRMKKKPLMNE